MNSFGQIFRITLLGESHGPFVGIVIDGCPAGIPLCEDDLSGDLERRMARGTGVTARREPDRPRFLSGLYKGHTTGAPVTVVFANEDAKPADYEKFAYMPRPSHADLTARRKWNGMNDPRGGGRFSGRMTVALVAAGAIAKKLMPGTVFASRTVGVGGSYDRAEWERIIRETATAGDSAGGIVETTVSGLPAGLGEPFFDSAESMISHALFSVPAVKGVEFGAGFSAGAMKGSDYNDVITDSEGRTATNHDGGINGGITNGNELVVRAALKPAPSIGMPQTTFDMRAGKTDILSVEGRHDACIALRAAVVVEAATAVALADLSLLARASGTAQI